MNCNLVEALKIYSLQGSGPFLSHLSDHSKGALIGMLSDLMTVYISDRNSSTLREFLTATVAGYTHSEAKIGYNGYKTIGPGEIVECEIKPKNIRRQDMEDFRAGKRRSKPAVLNGGGNFTDYTWARLKKDKEAAPNMLVSGFVDGRLLYIFEFPFNTASFVAKLEQPLLRDLPNGDVPRRYVRGAGFDYRDYIDEAKLVHRVADLEQFKDLLVEDFYERLAAMPAPPEVRE